MIHVFDFNHAKLVFLSTIIGVKPITIEEDYFELLIPGKAVLNYVFNDSILLSFVSFINDPRNHSSISCGR
jgi:hypothetical protein